MQSYLAGKEVSICPQPSVTFISMYASIEGSGRTTITLDPRMKFILVVASIVCRCSFGLRVFIVVLLLSHVVSWVRCDT